MKVFQVIDLDANEGAEPAAIEVIARSAEEAGQSALGIALTRHPGGKLKPRAKAYSQGDGGLTMVRLYKKFE